VWLKGLLAAIVVIGIGWIALAGAYSWSQQQYFIGEQDGSVVIFRGLNADLPGVSLSSPYETSDVRVDKLSDFDAGKVREGIDAGSLDAARRAVDNLANKQLASGTSGGS
jgi:protein phosphatase